MDGRDGGRTEGTIRLLVQTSAEEKNLLASPGDILLPIQTDHLGHSTVRDDELLF